MLVIALATPSYAQEGGWHKTYSTMASDTLYFSDNGAWQGSWFVRTEFNGARGDTVIWGKGGFNVPFDGTLKFNVRNNLDSTLGIFNIELHHLDTTIYILGGGFIFPDSVWSPYWLDHTQWTGTISRIDSISIVELYHPFIASVGPFRGDFDNFRVIINGQDVLFYDGGDTGSLTGTVYADQNQNGLRENGEPALGNWKVYLNGTAVDSTTTATDGSYRFTKVPRGTATLSLGSKTCWTQTSPSTPETSVTINTANLDVGNVDFGIFCPGVQFVHVNKGWNLVSVPRKPADFSRVALFPSAISRAFAYLPNSGYHAKDTLNNCYGYWLKFANSQDVPITGDSVTADTIAVAAGWNLVGSLSVALELGSVIGLPASMSTSQLFAYQQGRYVPATTLEPGQGYWIKVSEPGSLLLNASPQQTPAAHYLKVVATSELPPPPPGGYAEPPPPPVVPQEFALHQNYPNPFNPTTVIEYRVQSTELVSLRVYSVLGQEVATLANAVQPAGDYSVTFDATKLPSGVYFYQLRIDGAVAVKKLTVIK